MSALYGLLSIALQKEASDLHLVAGIPPSIRVDGDIYFLEGPSLTENDTRSIIYEILNAEQKKRFEEEWELDFSYTVPDRARFRASVYMSKGSIEGAFRIVPPRLRSIRELGLPDVVSELALRPNGLVLVTGPTGQGKTTTLNAMVDLINTTRRSRIITVEDPIEFVHTHKRSTIIQREVESDTKSFYNALIHALRQDPNVICVGEMRDLETIQTALTAAETGHLVLSTLHTSDAASTIDRIIDVFPPHQQTQVRIQLSSVLEGIICQQLLPMAGQRGRCLAVEILVATGAVRNIIREGKTSHIGNVITTSRELGMVPMERTVRELYERGLISYDTAISRVRDQEMFKRMASNTPRPPSMMAPPPPTP